MRTSQHETPPGEVDHHTPSAHWCAECWHWVVDCDHLVDSLQIEHRAVDDAWIRSLAYDRVHGRLEVEFKWDAVLQFYPVSPALFRDLWKSRPMRDAIDRIMKNRHIRDYPKKRR